MRPLPDPTRASVSGDKGAGLASRQALPSATQEAVDWLVGGDDPSIAYRTRTELLGEDPSTGELAALEASIRRSPSVTDLFEPLASDGSWQYAHRDQTNRYLFFVTTTLSTAAELCLDRRDDRVCRAVEHLFTFQCDDGDFYRHYSCLNGLILRTLRLLGYGDDPRTMRLADLIRRSIRHDGGYHCEMRPRRGHTPGGEHKSCIKGSLKALLAFADSDVLRESQECEHLADYFLRRHVCFRTGDLTRPVVRELLQTAFPITAKPGLLEAVYALARLGHGRRDELSRAWGILAAQQGTDGRVTLQRTVRWPHVRVTRRGKPCRWATLYALLALKYRDECV